MASTSRMLAKNLLPSPSPLEAPFTIPAISVNSKVVGTVFLGSNHFRQFLEAFIWNFYHPDVWINGRKGIVAASAPAFVIALNRVDLPTFGKPTIPAVNAIFLFSVQISISLL